VNSGVRAHVRISFCAGAPQWSSSRAHVGPKVQHAKANQQDGGMYVCLCPFSVFVLFSLRVDVCVCACAHMCVYAWE